MRIGKRISFSLDGVWTEWGFRRHARKRINVGFPGVWLISLGFNSGTPFYLNPRHVSTLFLTHFHAPAHATRDRTSPDPCSGVCGRRARAADESLAGPIARHLSLIAKILASASVSMVAAEAWDEASDLA